MAEETTIRPEPIVTSEAPRSQISTGDIVGPYQMLARSLDKLGQGLEDVATPLAEQAGYKAVTRDADGNIQVDRFPIFGAAGHAYAHAVKVGALAQGEGAAKRADIELREKYRDDPQGYQNAAQAFKDETVKQYTAAAGPEVGTALGQAIDNTTTYTYRGLLNEKERLDLQRAESAMNAGLKDASDDALALARQGASFEPGSPGAVALDKYTQLLDAKASNPRLAYSQEQRAFDLQKFQGELGGQRHLYHVDQTYKEKGYEAALDDAKDILTNEKYKLTPAQRDHYYHQAVGEIRANEAIRTQDYQLANENFREMKSRLALGERIEPAEIDAQRKAFQTIGGVKGAAGVAAVDSYFAHKDLHDDFGRQPIRDQLMQVNAIRGAVGARDLYQGLRQRGYSEAAAAGIAGNLVFESGGRPAIPGDAGTSAGLAQWHAERLTALKTFASGQGKDWRDPNVQLDFLDRELRTTESVTGGMLRAATTPEQAAQIFAVRFERPAGTDYRARQQLARSVFEGKSADGSGGPGVSSWLLANRAATLKTSATETWAQAVKDWDSGKGSTPSRDTISDVIDSARTTNNIDLMAKVQRDAELMDYADRIKQLPLDQQAGLETELRRRIAAGETRQADVPAAMDTPGADLVLKTLQEKTKAIQEGLKNDPISTVIANNPQRFKTPDPLDPSNPQQFVTGLAQRAQIARTGAQQYGVPPLSVLDKADVQRIEAALQNPDPMMKAQIYAGIATLPEDVRSATLRELGGKDPQGLANSFAGGLMAEKGDGPAVAASIFQGQQAIKADKRYDPEKEEGEGKKAYQKDIDTLLPPAIFSAADRQNPDGMQATMHIAIKDRYAFLRSQAGDTTYSADVLRQARDDVTGGLVYHNGAAAIAPARGMTQTTFDGVLQSVTDNDLVGVQTLGGQPINVEYLRRAATLESHGDGRYRLLLGQDPMRPIYAYKNGAKFELDLRDRQPVEVPRPPIMYEFPPPLLPAPLPIQQSGKGPMPAIGTQEHFEPTGYGGIRG